MVALNIGQRGDTTVSGRNVLVPAVNHAGIAVRNEELFIFDLEPVDTRRGYSREETEIAALRSRTSQKRWHSRETR